jgi:hypothetical protein
MGNTFYMAVDGDDEVSCEEAQSPDTPRQTLVGGVACLLSGDRLYALEGLYTGSNFDTSITPIPSGLDWKNPTTIAAAPDAEVQWNFQIRLANADESYIVFRDLILDGSSRGPNADGISLAGITHHIRFDNIELRNWQSEGLRADSGIHHIEMLGGSAHHNGPTEEGGGGAITFSGDDALFQGVAFYENNNNTLLIYSSQLDPPEDGLADRNTVRGCQIYRNGLLVPGSGIAIDGNENLIYNNLIYDNVGTSIFVGYSPASGDNKIFHNTVYSNTGRAVHLGAFQMADFGDRVENNIFFGNSNPQVLDEATDSIVQNNFEGDPLFVSTTTPPDLHLMPDSPAKNYAPALADVTEDFDGLPRPVGGLADAGAYEVQ